GMERILTIEADEITVSALFNRMTVDPFGLHGGKPGRNSGIFLRRHGELEWRTFSDTFGTMSPSKFSNIVLHRGDQVRLVAPGGGGWGDPLDRDPDRVLTDVKEGLITAAAARAEYGVEVVRANGTWQVTETADRTTRETAKVTP
ncbi:MAG: hydantoinase B/oxoprolinase family protein, partial [Acidimicrobiia bacterium]|nr:hydantoinase B/oxoprolinase family protein [Acidimicrobiia bacterium]